ncbi:recombinase [Streptomyces goshikiensis]|uniref:recombinase n=1 Tax=Streptomyces goshikiensis TaxID=1942 RepID=UPI00331772C6
MAFRLEEAETDLIARRVRAEAEGWLGEIDGIDLTLRLLRQKQVEARRLASMPESPIWACPW